ncbi:MAG TPA: glycosyltransferase [Nocardioides sp.]|uniref:glycosyltransferase n=1 Tax=Nocardioides sp. TaxID=35761 RepID=UPI002ED7CA07
MTRPSAVWRWFRRPAEGPLLSVVVPVYDVVDYLPASLDSILRQPVSDFELLVVDDGSTDGSAAVLADYARRDPRFRVLTQENAGQSVARNRAVAQARGEFLTFVDPDDELPADAWGSMLATLRRTRSDFVVGNVERVEGERRFTTPLMARNHTEDRLRLRIEDRPLMLADVFVWNKIFRRSFWVEHGITFPEGVRYEDQVALTQAFLAADRFDVLSEVVYEWRVREDRSSATQKRAQLANLVERFDTKQQTAAMVREYGEPRVLDVLYREVLPVDMKVTFGAAASLDGEPAAAYWEVLRDGMRALWREDTVPWVDVRLGVALRLLGWLVLQDRHDDFRRLWDLVEADAVPVEDNRYRHPWYHEPGLPEALRVFRRTPPTG